MPRPRHSYIPMRKVLRLANQRMEKGTHNVNTDKNPETQFTSVGGAAKILAVHPNTIRNMITSNALPAYHYGARCIRIRIDDVVKVLNPMEHNDQR